MNYTTIDIEKFTPIRDKLLVLPDNDGEDRKTAGGIIITAKSSETKMEELKRYVSGTVVAVSEDSGKEFSVGDKVMYQKMMELSVNVKDVRHVVLKIENIVGKIDV